MSVKEHVEKMKAGYQDQLAKVEQVKLDLEEKIQAADQIMVDFEAEKTSEYERGFNEGLAQAGQAGGSDKLYSDAELNAEIQPRDEKIAALASEVESVKFDLQIASEGKTTAEQALADFKSSVQEKLAAQQAAESALEAQFAEDVK